MEMNETLVFMQGIEKEFPGVHALCDCRFELKHGEVHALVGENGAGKSTLMKVLTGVYQKDAGQLFYKGKETDIPNTKSAQNLGISMIHQELNLMPDLTVAQNIYIGREPRFGWFLDDTGLNRRTEELLRQLNIRLDPRMKVADLTVAKQQMVEIAKALSFQCEVLVMDEPTAALTQAEIEDLFQIIQHLRESGVGVIYISHRMEELKRISDRITVMRDGCYIGTVATQDASIEEIISMMVGRELYHEERSDESRISDEVVLKVEKLSQGKTFHDISFNLRKGEILGFSGLMGAGRTEVARAIFGADPMDAGEIYIGDKKVDIKSPHDAVKHGIGYLSEDRKRYGLMVEMDVKTNIAVASMQRFTSLLGWMKQTKIVQTAEHFVDFLKIKTPSIDQQVKLLSGGNQQKVVISKWLTRDCNILIFDEPTRGIDVGAKSEIYKLLHELAEQGKSIIMISSELPEILRMSHRIVVMCEGRITSILNRDEADQETIMKYATTHIG